MDRSTYNHISRRSFLKGSTAALIGAIGAGMVHDCGPTLDSLEHSGALLSSLAGRLGLDPKRIYIAPDDHTDYIWTADEQTYQEAFLEMLDYYLDQADATADEPPDFQSRWNCDGSFWIWVYEKNRPAAQFRRLISRVRSGHVSFPLNALVVCLGGAPAEAVIRGMYYAGKIERMYDLRIPLAVSMENQTLPFGLTSLWAGSGAKYSWKGICNCASRTSAADREHEIYWAQGADGSRILMKWNSMSADAPDMGGYSEARYASAVIDYVDNDPGFVDRYPYRVIGAFGQGRDDLRTLNTDLVKAAQEHSTPTRRVIVSNQQDFFEDFDEHYGREIPTVSCSFGNEWDLYCASMAELSSRVKRAVEKLRNAEALSTMICRHDSGFLSGRQTARDRAWMNLGLYWEHDWTADGPVGRQARADWQRRIAEGIESYVDTLHSDAMSAFGDMIESHGPNLTFYVFNALSWPRTDIANLSYSGPAPVHTVDKVTGLEVPSQIVQQDGQRFLRILASDVPSTGYKTFEVRMGAGERYPDAATFADSVLENASYRVAVTGRGAISSWLDKSRGHREFAGLSDQRAVNDLGPGDGKLTLQNAGPVSVTVSAVSDEPVPHTSRITLLAGVNRIDIRNVITAGFDEVHTWSFAFDLQAPDVWHEEVGAVIRARLLEEGGHYSPRNARYDWLTLNHFADMSGEGGVGVTLSNADCYFMKLGASTPQFLDTRTPRIAVLAGGQVDGPSLGIPAQGGDTRFLQRFALRTHSAYDPVGAMKFALEHQNPLLAGVVTGGTALPAGTCSMLRISNPKVLLWALKPSEEGRPDEIIARVANLSTEPASFALEMAAGPLGEARHVSHIETPIATADITDGRLTDTLAATQIKTYSFRV